MKYIVYDKNTGYFIHPRNYYFVVKQNGDLFTINGLGEFEKASNNFEYEFVSERDFSSKLAESRKSKALHIADVSKRLFTLKEAQEIFFAGVYTNHESFDEKTNEDEYDSEFLEMIKRNYF